MLTYEVLSDTASERIALVFAANVTHEEMCAVRVTCGECGGVFAGVLELSGLALPRSCTYCQHTAVMTPAARADGGRGTFPLPADGGP